MSKRRWWIAGIATVVLVAVVISVRSGPEVEVETAEVTRGPLRVTVTEKGMTRVRERYTVAAPISGRLSRIDLEAGDRIERGDILAVLHPPSQDPRTEAVQNAQLAAARAAAAAAEDSREALAARAEQMERDLRRAEALAADSIVSTQEVEQLQAAVQSARRELAAATAAVQAAQADAAAARAALMDPQTAAHIVRAPTAGRVLRVFEKSERVVPGGTPLVAIGDASGLEVVVDVLSQDAVRISPGDSVLIDAWGGDTTLHAVVRSVEPEAFTKVSALGVEEQRVNVVADLVNTPAALGSGYRLEASVIVWQGDAVLLAPTAALFRDSGSWHVFAVRDGEASRQELEVGHRSADFAQVLAGLEEGDQVVLFPPDELDDGTPLAIRDR